MSRSTWKELSKNTSEKAGPGPSKGRQNGNQEIFWVIP